MNWQIFPFVALLTGEDRHRFTYAEERRGIENLAIPDWAWGQEKVSYEVQMQASVLNDKEYRLFTVFQMNFNIK